MLHAMPSMICRPREAYAQSLAGLVIWVIAVTLLQPGWAPVLLLFGPLVLFPLLFEITEQEVTMRRLALVAFLPVLASYGCEQGTLAGVLTLPWLVFTLLLLGHRLLGDLRTRNFVMLLIKGYLIVGASWLALARFGIRPLDFEPVIVHATAVHFHYAGFTLPIVALQLARRVPGKNVMLAGLLLGVPLVATGITLSQFGVRWFECAAACFFVAVCIWFAVEQLRLAFATRSASLHALLLLSSISLIVAMSLAVIYATGNYLQLPWLDIPFMLRWHGPIQVFGFALPGVVAWSMMKHNESTTMN